MVDLARLLMSKTQDVEHSISRCLEDLKSNSQFVELVLEISQTLNEGNRLALVGNGGSAAEAMHIAAEFTGKCLIPHEPMNVLCLNESQSAITAIGNDYGFDQIFARMIKAHLKSKDVLILLSTSGKSPNILNAIEVAIELGIRVFLWTGEDCPQYPHSNLQIMRAPTRVTPRVQEIHLIWGHLLAELIEEINSKN